MPSACNMRPMRPMSERPKICQIVPTTFHGISSDRATTTSTAEDFHPCVGIDSASRMPSGISTASTASEKLSWRHSAACSSSSRITAADHSVAENTRRSGLMMSCTEELTTVISGRMAEKATQTMTGRIRNQALWFTGLVVELIGNSRASHCRAERLRAAGQHSCQQLLVSIKAGVLAQHLKPDGVARRGQPRCRTQARLERVLAHLGGQHQAGADVLHLRHGAGQRPRLLRGCERQVLGPHAHLQAARGQGAPRPDLHAGGGGRGGLGGGWRASGGGPPPGGGGGKFRGGEPMKYPTNTCRGRSNSASAEPVCSARPRVITTTWSAKVSASTWSCVT